MTKRHNVPEEFIGLGVRIEDDVLITEDGPEILTKACPRDIDVLQKIASQTNY